jgi:long-chain fatty acid transport protein
MGGAGVAVARDTGALGTNPAGLSQLAGVTFDGILAAAFALDVAHADRYGNDQRVANGIVPNLGAGISKRVDGSAFTLGIGVLGRPASTRLTTTQRLRRAGHRCARSSAWSSSPPGRLTGHCATRMGATLNVHYAALDQRVYPNQSPRLMILRRRSSARPSRAQRPSGWARNFRAAVQATDALSLGPRTRHR